MYLSAKLNFIMSARATYYAERVLLQVSNIS